MGLVIPRAFGGLVLPQRFILPTMEFASSSFNTANASTYNFTSMNIGTASDTRTVLVGISRASSGTATFNSGTIAGVAMTNRLDGGAGAHRMNFVTAEVPASAGSSATISVTLNASCTRCGIGVWALYNLTSSVPTATVTTSTNPHALTIDVEADGFIIAYSYNGALQTATWTNATERFDEGGEVGAHTGADYSAAGAETGRAVSCNWASSTNSQGMAVAMR
jgi:hypothetical protein